MSHDHHHSHGPADMKNIDRAFLLGIGLNAVFTLIEFLIGYISGSLALLSDAAHNLSDVASLIIALIGLKLTQKASNTLFTYGYKKASILASLLNSMLILFIVLGILREAWERFASPEEIGGMEIVLVAMIGVIINAFSAFLFSKNQQQDINIRGAFIHLLVDALVSLGVVITGVVIYYTGWNQMDSWISIIIAGIILVSTWGLFTQSIRLALDGMPSGIDREQIKDLIESVAGVKDTHHLHIWALSSTENGLTSHVKIKTSEQASWEKIKEEIKHRLFHQNIQHVTLELEGEWETCTDNDC